MKKNDLEVKKEVWARQAEALACDRFRVTLMRAGIGRNFSNGGAADGAERFFTVSDVDMAINGLRVENARGWNVFITPIDPAQHHLVIDDVLSLNEVLALKTAGYSPCLVQQSSVSSIQCILRTSKLPGKTEQACANKLVVQINQVYGDKKFVGVIHPFRMAGFANKKPNRNNEFTKIIETNPGAVCLKATAELVAIRAACVKSASEVVASPIRRERLKSIPATPITSAIAEYARLRKGYEHACTIGIFRRDESLIDFKCAKEMAKQGRLEGEIAAAIVASSPRIEDRHPDFEKWAAGVAQNAFRY